MAGSYFRWLSHAALVVALLLLVVLGQRHIRLSEDALRMRARLGVLNAGDAIPLVRTIDARGDSIVLGHDGVGRRQLLFFLTKECPFCRATLPVWRDIAQLARDSLKASVSVVAVALDSVELIPAYLASYGISVPVVSLPDRRTRKLFRAGAVPQTVIIGDSGMVLYARTGQIVDSGVRDSVVAALLAVAPGRPSGGTFP